MTNWRFRRRRAELIAVFALAQFWGAPVRGSAQHAYVAADLAVFEHRGDPPMRMPTTVAVSVDGNVFVSDGVNDRVLEFDPEGKLVSEIHQVGDLPLSRPMSVKIDAQGHLWIADTGNARVVARRSDGTLERTIVQERGEGQPEPDTTDMAIMGDGETIWVVDNRNHQLVRYDQASGEATYVGGKGESLGQFHYPFMVATGKDDALFVTDVINARVQVLTASGEFSGTIGTYGLDLGQLYRPKGVACDANGNVWVADSTLGVVQVFTAGGRFIDVVRDAEGKPFRFETPTGIAFDSDDNLYVAELQPGRVRKLKITADLPSGTLPEAAREETAEGGQARHCTVCHLEWMSPLVEGRGTPLMDLPSQGPDDPLVSRSETCLSCHDGSVVDSRRRVWEEHGHRSGSEPPESMTVPRHLPLVNGRIACRTCHTAHVGEEPDGDISTTIFLRVENGRGQFCMGCHEDKAGGLDLGAHPTGDLPWPMPQGVIEAGARVSPNSRRLTCQVCHVAHGAAYDHLLVMAADSDRLCRACHEQMRPDMFSEEATEHPLSPKGNAEQVAAVKRGGGRVGPDGRLLCLSCHKLHDGKSKPFLLADEIADSQMCLQCHSEKLAVLETAHDLRKNFPEEANRLGMTAHAGGPCSSCHVFHGYARPPEDSPIDPDGGRCITCHQEGRCAQSKALGPISHPDVKCVACHDPHGTDEPKLLNQPAADLCLECHEQAEDIAGAHAFEDQPEARNVHGQSVADVGGCLMCHSMHRAVAKPLWGASLKPPETDREKCSVCHRPGGLAASKPVKEFNHTLACTACHNPHADSDEYPALLIVDPPAQNLCVRCHDEQEALVDGPHDITGKPSAWPAVSREKSDRCLACHELHGDEDTGLLRVAPSKEGHGPDAICLTCHPEAAPDADSTIALAHPRNARAQDEDPNLPLATMEDGQRQLICTTCHDPHRGPDDAPKLLRADIPATPEQLCLKCHQAMTNTRAIGHAGEPLQAAGFQAGTCQPCHAVHANPQAVERKLMWPKRLSAYSQEDASVAAADRHCRGCHRKGGPVAAPVIAVHPEVQIFDPATSEKLGFLPLFSEAGEVDPRGAIACKTCHLTHGRDGPVPVPESLPDIMAREVRARKWHLRVFANDSVCTICHGFDGLRRFLYFHDASRRGGPIKRGVSTTARTRLGRS